MLKPCETQFELLYGYKDPQGNVHKEIVMRKATSRDIIDIQRDQRLKEVSKDNIDIRTNNPVLMMKVNAQLFVMFSILFGRVITKVGDVPAEKIRPDLFLDLYSDDMQILMEKYGELNGVDVEESKNLLQGMQQSQQPN